MLFQTCIILLFLSLLSAAASIGERATSACGTERPLPAKALGGSVAQKRRAPARRAPGKAQGLGLGQGQGQTTQFRRPAQRPARKQPSKPTKRKPPKRKPPQQIPNSTPNGNNSQGAARQSPTYVVCYLYPVGSPVYRGIGPGQPLFAPSNGATYSPYITYKKLLSAKARRRVANGSANKMYGPQLSYPFPPYPMRLVCPLYQPVTSATVVSPQQISQYVATGPDSLVVDDAGIPVADFDPEIIYLPDDGEVPLAYDIIYEAPDSMYPTGDYITPQAAGYPASYPF